MGRRHIQTALLGSGGSHSYTDALRPRPAARPTSSTRWYHDESTFGYRVPAKYTLPDYTQPELDNRNDNAPLLRYVEMFRRHGHRAARVDPLDLMKRDEVGALSAERYGLEKGRDYPLQGILHVPPSSQPKAQSPKEAETDGPPRSEIGEGSNVTWTLEEVTEHLMATYVERIGHEYQHCPEKDERLVSRLICL